MNIRYLLNDLKIDDRTRDYVEEKIQRLGKFFLSYHEDAEISAEVEIDKDKKGLFRVEVMLNTPYRMYRGDNLTHSIEESVDKAYEELESQIERDKDRIMTLARRGGRSFKKKMTLDKNARF